MALGAGVTEPQKLGDNWRGESAPRLRSAELRAPSTLTPNLAQPVHNGTGVHVLAWMTAREQPWVGSHPARGPKVGPVVQEICEHTGEGFGHRNGFSPKGYPHVMRVDHDGCGRGDLPDGLIQCIIESSAESVPHRHSMMDPVRSDSLRVSRRCRATRPQMSVHNVVKLQAQKRFSGTEGN